MLTPELEAVWVRRTIVKAEVHRYVSQHGYVAWVGDHDCLVCWGRGHAGVDTRTLEAMGFEATNIDAINE